MASDDSEASFIGTAAKTWNKGAEALAKKMTDDGASRDEIWQATGAMGAPTFKDVDGKWKQEISDEISVPSKPYRMLAQSGENQALYEPLLKDYVKNDSVFSAYPDLNEVQIRAQGDGGSYIRKDGPNSEIVRAEADYGYKTPSILGHEMQHAIQEREGFARGGSPGMFAGEFAANRARLNFLEKDPETQRVLAEYDKKQEELIMSDLEDPSQALEELRYEYMSNPYFKEYEKVMRKLRGKTDSGLREYQRLAGEAEARNVETRLDYDMDERIANPPWNTLDVPENELIVRGQGGRATLPGMIGGTGAGLTSVALADAYQDYMAKDKALADEPLFNFGRMVEQAPQNLSNAAQDVAMLGLGLGYLARGASLPYFAATGDDDGFIELSDNISAYEEPKTQAASIAMDSIADLLAPPVMALAPYYQQAYDSYGSSESPDDYKSPYLSGAKNMLYDLSRGVNAAASSPFMYASDKLDDLTDYMRAERIRRNR